MRAILLAVLLFPMAAAAQMPGMTHDASPAEQSPSTSAFKAGMEKMHHGMDIPYSGDADRDFVAGMIPHHQGAIDMANVELKFGHDPMLRKLAHDIIAAQRREIAAMKRWQSDHKAP